MTPASSPEARGGIRPPGLVGAAVLIGILFWACAAARHGLLQSNAYDLGLFDQWSWLIGQGKAPISSMEEVHVLADHGAWMLYAAGAAYSVMPSLQWLLASQAFALSFTALPIWWLAGQAGLTPRHRWLMCGLWWLQPVVFNTNLFDFHPETWVMPLFALSLWAERAERPRLWLLLLLLMLGSRDGLVLILAGMAIDLALRQRWRWSASAAGLSIAWLLMLSRWLYPLLRNGEGPKAASRMFSHLNGGPLEVIQSLDWGGGVVYLVLLALPCIGLWRKRSLPTLMIGAPLLLVNLLSASPSYRTLIHHYSLPLAVVMVVAVIDAMAQQPKPGRGFSWALVWAVACWLALAKPWFFSGPYLNRISALNDVQDAISQLKDTDAVLTTSYLVPHLSQRSRVAFPKRNSLRDLDDSDWNVLFLNPNDPGWGSSTGLQKSLLREVQQRGWTCKIWTSGLEFCRRQ